MVRSHCLWEHRQPFFSGKVEPGINGRTGTLSAYFGQDVDGVVAPARAANAVEIVNDLAVANGQLAGEFAVAIQPRAVHVGKPEAAGLLAQDRDIRQIE